MATFAQRGIPNVPIGVWPDRVRSGDYFERVFSFCDENGDPIDFTGTTITLAAAMDPVGTQLVDFTAGVDFNGDPTLGQLRVRMTEAETAAAVGEGDYTIQGTLGGQRRTLQEGKLTIGRADPVT